MTDLEEIQRRRTFAIISHPDAGKTTLTEKLLLYGGAIHLAGSVKARKTARYAVSDWMEIEKQRGISVTSSVLQFDYAGCRINILDTPGHADFSEDTYRTLMAVDSAVMVIDVAKGVEAQTKKLFKVCSDRGIPIFTFVNKIDHFGKNPFDLMAEIEDVLGIRSCPMNWPIGVNGNYTGIYDRETEMCHLFLKDNAHGVKKLEVISGKIDDEAIKSNLTPEIIVENLADRLAKLDPGSFSTSWRNQAISRLLWLNEKVCLDVDGSLVTGVLVGIDERGGLLLATGEGIQTFMRGAIIKVSD